MLNQRRLSGTGVSDDSQKLPCMHIKADALHRAALEGGSEAVGVRQIFDL